MKRIVLCTLVGLAVFFSCAVGAEARLNKGAGPVIRDKLRVIILTDIGGDPDDEESMVRFLTYCNEFDVEGLIATTRGLGKGETKRILPEKIIELVKAYGKVRENLLLHTKGYPTEQYLLDRVKVGYPCPKGEWSMKLGRQIYRKLEELIGPDKDSEGSNWIIQAVDRADPRPLWICIWGGPSDLAQSLWRVRKTRSSAELARFISKIRVYAIIDQDTTGPWIRENFPDIFYIYTHPQPLGAHQGMFQEGDLSLYNEEWVRTNVLKGHGPLGKLYSRRPWKPPYIEGDTPSFLYLLPTGLGEPARPWLGCWGGRFQKQGARQHFLGAEDHNPTSWDAGKRRQWSVARWRRAFQNDFEARMDWCVKPFAQANHNPITTLKGDTGKKIVELTARPGSKVKLSAVGSSDPDGDTLSYRWFLYKEAGNYPNKITIKNANAKEATVLIPDDATGREIHIILEVTDNGKPVLYSYRRVIFKVR